MTFNKITPGDSISLFVKDILFFESTDNPENTVLPFFADGYPGLLFHSTPAGQWVQPKNKLMPVSYLYGQTLHPIKLHIKGSYRMIVFQLYPFVINRFFGLNAKDLNDECYDLSQMEGWNKIENALLKTMNLQQQVDMLSQFLSTLFNLQKGNLDLSVKEAIQLILNNKAQITVKELCKKLHLTVRTFERRFSKEVGIPAKDFIQITKFQQSFEQLTLKDYKKLTDIVYNNGFADQSHFIRVFKTFTGETPSKFEKNNIPRLS